MTVFVPGFRASLPRCPIQRKFVYIGLKCLIDKRYASYNIPSCSEKDFFLTIYLLAFRLQVIYYRTKFSRRLAPPSVYQLFMAARALLIAKLCDEVHQCTIATAWEPMAECR